MGRSRKVIFPQFVGQINMKNQKYQSFTLKILIRRVIIVLKTWYMRKNTNTKTFTLNIVWFSVR